MVTTVTDNSPQAINTSLFSLDKQVQEIKTLTDTFNDKISGINPKANVISVNGKQGIVTINAQDVHALPDTTVIPTTTGELTNNSGFITIEDVGASYVPLTRKVNNKELDADITLTASDVGALPDSTVVPTVVDTVASGNMNAVTSNAVAGALSGKANVNSGIVRINLEPRQINDISYLSSLLHSYFEEQGYSLIVFGIGWEDYQSYPYAGSMGYFMFGTSSARAYGQLRNYSDANYIRSISWTDSIETSRCSGWVAI